jgi:uncharacterized protein DUF481
MGELSGPRFRSGRKYAALLLLVLVMGSALPAGAAPKTDIVIFKNGDKLTGEIKSLQRGRLNLNTDATGTIGIEWDKIAKITSKQNVQVETSSGARYFGHLSSPEKNSRVVVETADGPQMLDAARVVMMTPIESKGRNAFDIDMFVGYNFAKAGGVKQATIGADVKYRTRLRILAVAASTTVNDSSEQDASKRSNVGLDYRRLWQKRWFVDGNLNLDQNDELGLNLRTSVGGGGGRYLIQSDHVLLSVQAGLQVSRENLIAEQEDTDSVEATFGFDWDWFRFDAPELDWSTSFKLYPNLSDWGRVRAELDTNVKWELINNLKWGFAIYSSYDNQPQSGVGETSDYGINTTLTYDF